MSFHRTVTSMARRGVWSLTRVLTLCVMLTGCSRSESSARPTDPPVVRAQLAALTDRAALARYWAPIHYQDTDVTGDHSIDGRADYITNFDFDGDWDGRNNWENTRRFPLKAYAYYSVVETATHWFITYMFFHPRDWTDDPFFDTEHENDAEGALLTVERDGSPNGVLRSAVTVAHVNFYSYVPDGSPWKSGRENIDGPLPMAMHEGHLHPVTAQEAKGHGLKAKGGYDINGDGVIYYPSDIAEEPENPDDRNVKYALIDIFAPGGLWERRNQEPTYAKIKNYRSFTGDDATEPDVVDACGTGAIECGTDSANPPWAWDDGDDLPGGGQLATDPAKLVAEYFSIPERLARDYTFNPYANIFDPPTPTDPPPTGPAPRFGVRLMPLGDSITHGMGSSTGNGYREPLRARLAGSATSFDFVGAAYSGTMSDPAHEGYPGYEIDQVSAALGNRITGLKPNIVTLHLGTNDVVHDANVGGAPARLGALIDRLLAQSPYTTIVLATLVPSRNPTYQARIQAFNQGVRALADAQVRAGKHVQLVDMGAVTTADLADEVHPNDAGYLKMADIFADGILKAARAGWIEEPEGEVDPIGTLPGGCLERGGFEDKGTIAAGVPGANMQSRVRFADIDGDGKDDYVVLDENAAIRVWLNRGGDVPGGGGWVYRGEAAAGTGAPFNQIRFADINGDKKDDYLIVRPGGALEAYINNGGDAADPSGWRAGWIGWGQIARGANSDAVEFADINGDGKDDYLVIKAGGALDYYENNGGDRDGRDGWIPRGQIARGAVGAGQRLHFGDINCDGKDDYLVSDGNGAVQAYLNNGGDTPVRDGWVPRGQIARGLSDPGVVFAELNGDGKTDYVLIGADGSLRAWWNRGGD